MEKWTRWACWSCCSVYAKVGRLAYAACNHPALIASTSSAPQTDAREAPKATAQDVGADPDDELADLLAGLSVQARHCERCQVVLPNTYEPVLCEGCQVQAAEEAKRGIVWKDRTSTKLAKTMALLEEFRAQDKHDKTIIFSQFTSFLDLLEGALSKTGIEFVRCTFPS